MKEAAADNSAANDNSQVADVAEVVGLPIDVPAQPTEIAASIVRSSLAQIETTATTMFKRIEAYKGSSPEYQPQDAVRQQPQEVSPHRMAFKNMGPSKKSPREVMASIEDLLVSLTNEDEQECNLPLLDEVSHMAVLQHATAAFVASLSRLEQMRLAARLTNEITAWLGKIFNFSNFHTAFYRNDMECTLQALRNALLRLQQEHRADDRVPQPATSPSDLASFGMTIYLSDKDLLLTVESICRYMGWPESCIRCISTQQAEQSSDGIGGRMDLELLESTIEADLANGCRPLMVIATVGSASTGLTDDLDKLIAVCASRHVWLHFQGLGLAALALTNPWTQLQPDSITLSLNSWLGVIGMPSVLLHKSNLGYTEYISTIFDTDPILANRLSSLSVWSALKVLGGERMQERIFSAFDSCQELCKMLNLFEDIRIVTLFKLAVPTVLFQFDGHTTASRSCSEQSANAEEDGTSGSVPEEKGIAKNRSNAQYYDQLNNWFGQNVVHDARQLNVAVIEHKVHGTVIRYCPFVTGYGEVLPRTPEALAAIENSIESHIGILRSTVLHRVRFRQLVAESNVLQLIELRDWAGLGGVQYEPEGWLSLSNSVGIDEAVEELNKFNQALVEALQATDGAFSQGESDGLICVRFGMVTRETDVEELLELVIQTARSVQENSKVLDTMTEIVKKGIEAATIDLQREAEEKLRQEGILRQVPLVGRVVNWWMPPSKETGMKGRSLNLTQGVVESTENIYKYHMQMTPQTSNQLPGNKAPPAPLVQKPITTDQQQLPSVPKESAQHSRNASSSSELSGRGGGAIPSPPVLIKLRKPMLTLTQQVQLQQQQQQQQESPQTTLVQTG
uniref:Pyridoxal-dependent decarboxylase domain-containing protein 1 n=1 Tax=Anopheles atroparvus TaxID=41427 RepID=A0A182JC01_ANOAO